MTDALLNILYGVLVMVILGVIVLATWALFVHAPWVLGIGFFLGLAYVLGGVFRGY